MFSLLCPSEEEQFAWTDKQKSYSLTAFGDLPFNYSVMNHFEQCVLGNLFSTQWLDVD